MKLQVELAPHDRKYLEQRIDGLQYQVRDAASFVASKTWNGIVLGVYVGIALGFITALVWFSQPTDEGRRGGRR